MHGVIAAAFVAPLMLGTDEPPDRSPPVLAALVAAVTLPTVVRPADHEGRGAVGAGQREDSELVHPAWMVENWTATSGTKTVRLVLARPSVAAGTEGSGGDLGPHSFHRSVNYPDAVDAPPLLEWGGPHGPR